MKLINAFASYEGDLTLITRVNGERVIKREKAQYISYHKYSEISESCLHWLKSSPLVRELIIEPYDHINWLRINWVDYEARQNALWGEKPYCIFESGEHYEGDLSPVMRYLIDNNVEIAKPKRCYIDLETDSRVPFIKAVEGRAAILSWALVDDLGHEKVEVLNRDSYNDEQDLVMSLWQELQQYEQVLAWNGDGFDFKVIKERTKYLGLSVNHRYWLWLDHMLLFKRLNTAAESGDEKTSYKLNDIAQAILGEGKDTLDGSRTWYYWEKGGSDREALVKYNLKDTKLLQQIEKKTGLVDLFQSLCEVTGVLPDTYGLQPVKQVDSFLLRLAKPKGLKFLSKNVVVEHEKFKGAYVMPPEAHGIEKNIHVADFQRLYPSIMISWNMSPETKSETGECLVEATGVRFSKLQGILPFALKKLIDLRKKSSKDRDELPPGTSGWYDANRLSTAYKVAANSFYGVVGSSFSRFFDAQIAESVTQTGAQLIKETIKEAENRGMKAIYADTDSLFVKGVDAEVFKSFVSWCNETLYPQMIERMGCVENDICLAYEKAFDRVVFVGAKKYVGSYLHYKGKRASVESKPEIKGLEYRRGDSVFLARKLQIQVIEKICAGCEDSNIYEEIVQKTMNHVLNEPLSLSEVIISKTLSKEVEHYSVRLKKDGTFSALPRHVVVAKDLIHKGVEVSIGTRIGYVVMDASVRPLTVMYAEEYDGVCDRYYLWDSLVYPPTFRLLSSAFPLHDWTMFQKTRPEKIKPVVPGVVRPRGGKKSSDITAENLVKLQEWLYENKGVVPFIFKLPWKSKKVYVKDKKEAIKVVNEFIRGKVEVQDEKTE
jgi:DNA polymerase elongation subunit (family B)